VKGEERGGWGASRSPLFTHQNLVTRSSGGGSLWVSAKKSGAGATSGGRGEPSKGVRTGRERVRFVTPPRTLNGSPGTKLSKSHRVLHHDKKLPREKQHKGEVI